MRINPDETYEQWTDRVRQFELQYARQQLAKGVPVDQVLARMSDRIQQKILHPIIVAIKDVPISYDLTENKKAYRKAYLNKNSAKPDHVSED
jgi:glutamyl-tRNA reductase